MTFANPAGHAAAAARGYVRALLDVLGERDPLEVAGEQLAWLDARLGGVPDAVLRRPEAPGKWSAAAIVQHLADTEVVYAMRTRMVLTEERPGLAGFDQDAWARVLRYEEAPLDLALAQLRAVRGANLRLWGSLTPEQRAREGLHSERGPESLDLLLRLMGAHDLVHRRQLERVLATVR